eukprot:6200878-Pleurochrysis_carterae.AAC.1
MVTDWSTALTRSPSSPRRCASAGPAARACRRRCGLRSLSAGLDSRRLLERSRAASATAFALRGILCAPCPSSPCPG